MAKGIYRRGNVLWIAYVGLAVIVYVAGKMIYDGWVDPAVGIGTLFS